MGRLVTPAETLAAVADEPGNRFSNTLPKRGSNIIAEDKAMLRLKEFRGAKIMRVADFIVVGTVQ